LSNINLADNNIQASPADITAYTTIFTSTTSTPALLKSFLFNAKKGSPRSEIATYLSNRYLLPASFKVPKLKNHVNPYLDLWTWSCQETGFMGPLEGKEYADPRSARLTHPVLPVLYHHFGCVCPSWEGLWVVSQFVGGKGAGKGDSGGVLEMASGNGYWSYLLMRMGIDVVAVDDMSAVWRTMWIEDTVKANGVEYLKKVGGARDRVLLMVYMVPRGDFTKQVLKAYKGDTIVIAGTQNENRFTGFSDTTVEEYFAREKKDWEMTVRIALPSFAGKDEAMYVYQRRK
jgi:hypothetical protein